MDRDSDSSGPSGAFYGALVGILAMVGLCLFAVVALVKVIGG